MITINELIFNYRKENPLFRQFSLQMEAGRIVGLLGKNGAGKSTLLSLIAGLLMPQKGEITVNGYKPSDRNPHFLSDIYVLPEETVLPSMSVAGYLKALMPLYRNFDKDKLYAIFKEFGLKTSDKLDCLSQGQRKKFLIAFALSSNCKLLIMDEPTNGLDIPSKSLFRKVLVRSITDEQLVLISTHQVKDIDTIIDRLVVIDEGSLICEDDMAEIGKKYHFKTVQSLDGVSDILYQEKCPQGYRIICPSDGEDETLIDMELFFNALIYKTLKHTLTDENK